ncbi:cullin-1-like [Papaver somniferum]|uniref:cullin-1-like n=1 Tax=Papaver somniferum TaxID=3469 RepID=UPI000E701522|nr:cullin-1-like [Papaver somniferum]
MNTPVVELEEGWAILQMGITKVINIIEGVPGETAMDAAFYMKLYTAAYNMCNQKPPHHYITQLYERYEGVYNDYLQSKVLPAIQEKRDNVSMLQELVKRWVSYKDMVRRLSQPFNFLNRNYVAHKNLPMFKDVGFGCFLEIVGAEIEVQVKDAVLSLINKEREGEEIDQTLVKNVLEIFVDIGNENDAQNMEYYVNDFETPFLNDTADYYSRKASNWTREEYAMKAEECLKTEKDRASHYLHSSTEEKLLKIVQDVLNTAYTIA